MISIFGWSQDEPTAGSADLDEINKQLQNPIADLISLPFQNNTSFGLGPDNRTQNVLNIQPIYPITAGKVNIITRTIFPLISQPVGADESDFGLGDILFTAFVSPINDKAMTWGVGPALSFPTATESTLGSGKWSAGPSVVALAQTEGGWTIGGLINNVWSFAGQSDRADVNFMTFQPFVALSLPKSWTVSVAPILTSNWEAPSGEQWTVPLGGGASKVVPFGKLPVNLSVQAYYNVERPTFGPEWSTRLVVAFVFPK
mgnify:CR=1 FL=1